MKFPPVVRAAVAALAVLAVTAGAAKNYVTRNQAIRKNIGNNLLHIGVELGFLVALVIALGVLGRNDDGGRLDRLAIVEAQGDLALGVGLQERGSAGMAVLGHPLQDLVAVAGIRSGVSSQAKPNMMP